MCCLYCKYCTVCTVCTALYILCVLFCMCCAVCTVDTVLCVLHLLCVLHALYEPYCMYCIHCTVCTVMHCIMYCLFCAASTVLHRTVCTVLCALNVLCCVYHSIRWHLGWGGVGGVGWGTNVHYEIKTPCSRYAMTNCPKPLPSDPSRKVLTSADNTVPIHFHAEPTYAKAILKNTNSPRSGHIIQRIHKNPPEPPTLLLNGGPVTSVRSHARIHTANLLGRVEEGWEGY